MRRLIFVMALPVFWLVSAAADELTLNPLFADGGVLQVEKPLPIWGTAPSGAEVMVELRRGDEVLANGTAVAKKSGEWMVILSKQPLAPMAGDTHTLIVQAGETTVERAGILLGEVWLCTGQSNMAMGLKTTDQAEAVRSEADAGAFSTVRLFKVLVRGEDQPSSQVNGQWVEASAANLDGFSATGSYFMRGLRNGGLEAPVGLIHVCMGGTNVYSWITPKTYEQHSAASVLRRWWPGQVAKGPAALERFEEAKKAWAEGGKEGRAPREPMHARHLKRPTGLYNGMIAPLQPFAVRGAIWYQGEANSRPPWTTGYADFLTAMVEGWHAEWALRRGEKKSRDAFPFLAVQLPAFAGGHAEGWPLIREQFSRFADRHEWAEAVVTIDSGEATDIHPKDKHIPGERLALAALRQVYGWDDVVDQGPRYQSSIAADGAVKVNFDQLLSVAGEGGDIRAFEVAGKDGVFHSAEAAIDGDQTIVLTSEAVTEPVMARYAWSSWLAEGVNLVNAEGLPVAPFRTGTWGEPEFEAALEALPPDTAARMVAPEGATRHVYKIASGWELNLYVFQPDGAVPGEKRPGAVFFFGGGWSGGSPNQFVSHCRYLAKRGMVAVVADYRVSSRQGTPPTACVEDGRSAVRWLRQHAEELGLDPNRLAAGGGSAGGHVASATGMLEGIRPDGEDQNVSSKPNALLLFNPVYDNGPEDGWGHARVVDYWQEISPAHNITADDPPAIVFLGTEDSLIPVKVAERFRDQMIEVGLKSELHLYEGQPHGFFNYGRSEGNTIWKDNLRKVDAFLQELSWLTGPVDEVALSSIKDA